MARSLLAIVALLAAHAAARFGRVAPLVRLRGGHDGRALIGTLLASPDMSPPDVKASLQAERCGAVLHG